LAQKLQALHQSSSDLTTVQGTREAPAASSPNTDSGEGPVIGTNVLGGVVRSSPVPVQRQSDTSEGSTAIPGIFTIPPSLPGHLTRALFVLLCVPRGVSLKHGILIVLDSEDDDAFFEDFRSKYKSLRGFWRYWLDPRQFGFCDASKFDKWYANRLGYICNELPSDQRTYEYVPRPPAMPYEGILSKHEWRDRFHQLIKSRGLHEAVEKMPKRNCRFQISTHVAGREFVWGLHARLRISAVMVMMWQIIITLGGWIFMAWWLKGRSGDLQNASVPITLIIGALMLLWLPLNEKFKDNS
jgi:hypothetical protein